VFDGILSLKFRVLSEPLLTPKERPSAYYSEQGNSVLPVGSMDTMERKTSLQDIRCGHSSSVLGLSFKPFLAGLWLSYDGVFYETFH
jgi:hypothetical protein